MEEIEYVYKVTVKQYMGIAGVSEILVFYFRDVGDISFSKRLVDCFQHGMGTYSKDFFIESVENLGPITTTERT